MTPPVEPPQLHPTTECCLEALQWLRAHYDCERILDIGCGSGILSLVAAGLWNATDRPVQVLAADISPEAVANTEQLSTQHGMTRCITVIRSDGFKDARIRDHSPYDLIICNLLAEPIIAWAPQMQSHLAPNGLCLLSGILAWFAEDAEIAYKNMGLEAIHRIDRSPWVTLMLQRKAT